MTNKNPIGIIDSGVGGLTVVKELQTLLPDEDIIYFGDNKNVPYGSKSQEEIISLTKKMLDFLVEHNVKLVGVGCNTISTVLNLINPDYDLKIIGIVDPTVKYIAKLPGKKVGLIATPFTVNSKYYNQTLASIDNTKELVSEGCPQLATLIDRGDFNQEELKKEVEKHITPLVTNHAINSIVLGCTHYPIILDLLKEYYPGINFINPAFYQAMAMKEYLTENNLLANNNSYFEVYTTGDREKYQLLIKMLNLKEPDKITKL